MAEKYEIVYATAGYHPHESKHSKQGYLKDIKDLLSHDKVIALGEIGLDYYYNNSKRKTQKKVFIEQLELAKELNMPVIIHNRDADSDILESLNKININKGVIHCFASDLKFAQKIISLNLYLSFTGLITFATNLEKVVKNIPIDKIMLETDSPYLTPVPFRGKRNEPYMVKFVAEKVAQIKKMTLEDVSNITTKTASEFFGI